MVMSLKARDVRLTSIQNEFTATHFCLVFQGSPFCRADLRAVNANLADMVVFLSPSTARKTDGPKLADKVSILASLNLKAMSFDDAVGMLSENTRNAFAGLEFHEPPQVERRGSAYGCNVPIITEVGKCFQTLTSFPGRGAFLEENGMQTSAGHREGISSWDLRSRM